MWTVMLSSHVNMMHNHPETMETGSHSCPVLYYLNKPHIQTLVTLVGFVFLKKWKWFLCLISKRPISHPSCLIKVNSNRQYVHFDVSLCMPSECVSTSEVKLFCGSVKEVTRRQWNEIKTKLTRTVAAATCDYLYRSLSLKSTPLVYATANC